MRHCLALVALAAALAAGCSPSPERSYKVQGKVLFDDRPLADGKVIFTPESGSAPSSLAVKNGTYEGEVHPGKNKVQIAAYRDVPAAKGGGPRAGEGQENYIPARYNSATTLSAEIVPDSKNEFNFELKSR